MNLFQTIRREIASVKGMVETLGQIKDLSQSMEWGVADDLEAAVDRHASKDAFIFEGTTWSFADLDARANRFAHVGKARGLQEGDVVALYLDNRPDYVAAWFGFAKIGVTTALLNNNLTGGGLAHCLDAAAPKLILCAAPDIGHFTSLERHEPILAFDGPIENSATDIEAELGAAPTTRPPLAWRAQRRGASLVFYVYTSGTTGKPKAAKITHHRALVMMRAFRKPIGAREGDRMYIVLPLYHGTGGLCGVGAALLSGAGIILRRRFSATHFWPEAIEQRATLFVYIGELCRYLVNTPPSPHDRAHSIRACFGNGLRPDVWAKFRERFGIRQIVEFYGSTEGNVSLVNLDGKVGSIGRVPPYVKSRFNIEIVKFDVETESVRRRADGLCARANFNEAGEAIGEIGKDDRFKFDGYTGDPAQTEKKLLRNVFAQGDLWFRTGDLMRKDREGYFYFVDRIGDTFRWKGENVSTQEVAEVLAGSPGIAEANVYGVAVGQMDGRAGMASLAPTSDFSVTEIAERVARDLPVYARPVFLRLQQNFDTTGTFKYRKVELVRDGFDPEKISDPLYYRDPQTGGYKDLTPDIYRAIQEHRLRL